MKIRRDRFDYLMEQHPNPKSKVYKIGKDKYIQILSFKRWLNCIVELFEAILTLPFGIVSLLWAFLELVWDFLCEIPSWVIDLFKAIKDILPIRYIEVYDEELQESIE